MKKYNDDWFLLGELPKLKQYAEKQRALLSDPSEDRVFGLNEIKKAEKRIKEIEAEMARRAEESQ